MSEATANVTATQEGGKAGSMGVVQGVPARQIESVGVLDLRGVPAEQVAQIESIRSTGVVLVDEANRTALEGTAMHSVGAVAAVGPDFRVILEPCLEISKSTLEAMPSGQKLMLVGVVFFKPDVPPALVAEKIEAVHFVGVLLACASVQGALLGRMQTTGVSVALPDDVGPIVRSMGQTKLNPGYLSHLQDGVTYLNLGLTELTPDVTEPLLAQKIAAYYNMGLTTGPGPLLDLLKARCSTNMGQFKEQAPQTGSAPSP